jgi:hypothetical protein
MEGREESIQCNTLLNGKNGRTDEKETIARARHENSVNRQQKKTATTTVQRGTVGATRQTLRHRHRVLDLDEEREPICDEREGKSATKRKEEDEKTKDGPDSAPVRQTTTNEEERLYEWMRELENQRRLLEQELKGKKRRE